MHNRIMTPFAISFAENVAYAPMKINKLISNHCSWLNENFMDLIDLQLMNYATYCTSGIFCLTADADADAYSIRWLTNRKLQDHDLSICKDIMSNLTTLNPYRETILLFCDHCVNCVYRVAI